MRIGPHADLCLQGHACKIPLHDAEAPVGACGCSKKRLQHFVLVLHAPYDLPPVPGVGEVVRPPDKQNRRGLCAWECGYEVYKEQVEGKTNSAYQDLTAVSQAGALLGARSKLDTKSLLNCLTYFTEGQSDARVSKPAIRGEWYLRVDREEA